MKKTSIIMIILFFIPAQIFSIDFFRLKESIINNSWKKIGFVYIQPAFMLENAGYSTNIFSYNDIVEPDYKADIGLKVNFSMFIGNKFIISVEENPYYTYYAEHKDQEYFNNGIKTSFYSWMGKFNFSYSFTLQDVKRQPSSEFGADVISKVSKHSVSIDYGRHDVFFLTLFYNVDKMSFEDKDYFGNYDLVERMNRDETSLGGQMNKVIFTRTIIYLKGENYRYRYNFEEVKNGTGAKISVGIKLPEVGPLEGDFSIGLNYFKPGDELAEKYSKLFGSGKISISPIKQIRINLGFLLDNFYSFWDESAYYNEERYNVGIDYYIGKKLKAGYEYRAGSNTYYFLNGEAAGRIDSSSTSTIKVGFRLSGKIGLGINYIRFNVGTNVIDFNRSYNFIGGYLTHDF